MYDPRFTPFYERLTIRFPGRIIGEALVSALLGLAFLAVRYASIGDRLFDDWSWLLSVLITTAMFCLYLATHTLRAIFPEMDMRLRPHGDEVYLIPLKRILSDRNFILAGLFFGILNCALGICFGILYETRLELITILSGFFLAGFVCGMPVWGIYGICVSITAFARKAKSSLDFTSPDRCGGTLFLGQALVLFSLVTLIVGVLISIYILKLEWKHAEMWWVKPLVWFWVAFPYIMSLVVLVVPAVPINEALNEYKIEQEVVIQDRLTEIAACLEDNKLDASKRKELREECEFQRSMRTHLHKMRTWPYGLGGNLKYFSVVVVNLAASAHSVKEWLNTS
jgi:hypothetical protein